MPDDQEKLSPLNWKEMTTIERASVEEPMRVQKKSKPRRKSKQDWWSYRLFLINTAMARKKGCKRAFLLSLRHCTPPIGKEAKEMLAAEKVLPSIRKKRNTFSCFFIFPPFFREGFSNLIQTDLEAVA